ncbi:MAG TPA: hypothetical protein PK431_08290 [Chitinophagales bacterium]|jgi:CheY-like chemotaxis protein|nr:hypothetical protein [Chitinophagales bacterium]
MVNALIIEDNEDFIKPLRYILEVCSRNPYYQFLNKEIEVVTSLEEAESLLIHQESKRFNLIFWDIDLDGQKSFELAKLFPEKSLIIFYSSERKYYTKVVRENENILNRLQHFEPEEKALFKDIEIGGEIDKNSIGKNNEKNLVYKFVCEAERKFGYRNIMITQYNEESIYLNPMEIVMIMTYNKACLKIDDENSVKALKDRKIIFTKTQMILTNTSDNVGLNDYLNIRHDHKSFIIANENCLINLHHALNIKHNDRYYYFTMQTSLFRHDLEFFTKGLGKEDKNNIGKLGPKYRPYYTLEALPNHNIIKLSESVQSKNKEFQQLIANNLRV